MERVDESESLSWQWPIVWQSDEVSDRGCAVWICARISLRNVKMVRICIRFFVVLYVIPSFYQFTIGVLPMKAIGLKMYHIFTLRFLTHIHKEGKIFYSEIKSNRNIFMHHPVKKQMCLVKPDKHVTLTKKYYSYKIKYLTFKIRMALKFHIRPIRSTQS